MAMIISSAARLKPELRLAEAISLFEASLTSAQKDEFRDSKLQLLKRPPDSTDVMRLTADVDRRVTQKRCFGPRFTNFLSTIQQFAALGDVVVGGSQNIIACGVWSLVRMSILALTSFSSHIENLSFVFMEIGRSSPRYQDLALLYPRSERLQAAMNEYLIIVVQFCRTILQFAQKSTLRQFTSTMSGTTIKTAQTDLAAWARKIQDEIQLLVSRRIEEEAKENSKHRSLSTLFSKSVSSHQRMFAKLRILDKCSTYDYETSWKQIRKMGNTSIFATSADYLEWRLQATSGTLLYLGILGCGKSVAMANMIDDLNLFVQKEQDKLVAYFFVRHDLPLSSKSRTIVGAIARQLLRLKQDLATSDEIGNEPLNIDGLLSLLYQYIGKHQRIFLVLDGLDLCDYKEKQKVTGFLQELQQQRWVLVCASYRQEPNVQLDDALLELLSVRAVSLPDNEGDIEAFIETELARRVETRSLTLGDPTLILDIQDALLAGSKGMFLWVALQIHSLCALQTDEEIREALAHLPRDLLEIYAQLLHRQQGPAIRYQRRIFELITVAQQPLTTEEIREALSVTPGDTTWSAAKLINDVYSALASCGCLIVVDEEELTVRFVHPTVRQYLLERYTNSTGESFTSETCHRSMADIIVTYLNYGVFDTTVSTFRVPQVDVAPAPSRIIHSTLDSTGTRNLALKLMKLRKRPGFDIGKTLAEELHASKKSEALIYHFENYANTYCLQHISQVKLEQDTEITSLFAVLLNRGSHASTSKMTPEHAWVTALDSNDLTMVKLLLESKIGREVMNRGVELPGRPTYSVMALAICHGVGDVMNLIPEELWRGQRTLGFAGLQKSPCYVASYGSAKEVDDFLRAGLGRLRISQMLRQSQFLGHICHSGRSILSCAIWRGNKPMARVLLDADNHRLYDAGTTGMTPLWEAVRQGDVDSFNLLLKNNAPWNFPNIASNIAGLIALAEELGYDSMRERLETLGQTHG